MGRSKDLLNKLAKVREEGEPWFTHNGEPLKIEKITPTHASFDNGVIDVAFDIELKTEPVKSVVAKGFLA